MSARGPAIDLGFLHAQTFGDDDLARELLTMFRDQARRLAPRLPGLAPEQATETAHLLKGSCLGIGANDAAALLDRYDSADARGRRALHLEIATAFADLEAAIGAHLDAP